MTPPSEELGAAMAGFFTRGGLKLWSWPEPCEVSLDRTAGITRLCQDWVVRVNAGELNWLLPRWIF